MQDRWILLLLLAALVWACSPREQVQGTARVIDGDSLEIAGTSIRLFGVDAPEGRQTCTRNGRTWRCGDAAAERLEQLVGNDTIVCTQRDTDNYGRTVAVCVNGDIDLSAELALSGLALAYREYSYDYVDEEAEALAARRGLWSGEFQAPWDWRRNPAPVSAQPAAGFPAPSATPADPGGCLIKGNINSRGDRIFHAPGSPSYEQTVIDPARGERMFCTEEEAIDAGWRAPRG